MKSLVDYYVFTSMPGSTVLLSTLVPNWNGSTQSCVVGVNAQYRSLATQYRNNGNSKIYLADMHAYLNEDDIDSEGTHPNDDIDALRPTCAKVAGNGIGINAFHYWANLVNAAGVDRGAELGDLVSIDNQTTEGSPWALSLARQQRRWRFRRLWVCRPFSFHCMTAFAFLPFFFYALGCDTDKNLS